MKLSLRQKQAIDPHFSCWVEASAGTGKTKVLTDRVLSLLLSGVPASEILCLTFTKAAGAEMANRLRARLRQWKTLDTDSLKNELEDFLGKSLSDGFLKTAQQLFFSVLESSSGIRIQTIHGFCQFLLRTFPLESGLLPHFKIMGDGERNELIRESCEQLWVELDESLVSFVTRRLSEGQFSQFLESFLAHKGLFLKTSIDQLEKNLQSYMGINVQENISTSFSNFFEKSFSNPVYLKTFPEKGGASDQKLHQALRAFKDYSPKDKRDHFQEYKGLFLTETGSVRKSLYSKTLQKTYPDLAIFLEEEACRVQAFQENISNKKIMEQSLGLMRTASKFLEIYERIKIQRAWIDYDDLIIRARDLLKERQIKPWILEKLDYKLKHILVDEAQDTSQIQWELILALIEEFYMDGAQADSRTFFVVGDPKQSIYGFQGACPQAFMEAKKAFRLLPKHREISLSTSYRSAPSVLEVVDHVFRERTLTGEETSGISHDVFRKKSPGVVALWPLVKSEAFPKKEGWSLPEIQHKEEVSRRILAQKIAGQIDNWFQSKEILHSKERLLKPKDIMILVRRRDVFMEEIVRALKGKNIPVTGLDRMVLSDQLAVKDLLCLCDVLLLPEDDLSLATLLKSPFFSISEEDLLLLCQERGDQSLWSYLQTLKHYEKTVSQLVDLRKISKERPPCSFFSFILTRWGGRSKLVKRLGEEIEDVLEEFLSTCHQYEEDYGPHLQLFVSWIRKQNIEVKRSLEQTEENQVRIMTVHGSKGLQAPVVFLPDTTQIPTKRSPLYWHNESPFLLWADLSSRRLSPQINSLFEGSQDIQEYYRLLYVALTRAEDRLYVCGWSPQREIDKKSWYSLLEETMSKIGVNIEIEGLGLGMQYGNLPSEKCVIKEDKTEERKITPDWVREPWRAEGSSVTPPSVKGELEKERNVVFDSSHQKQKGILIHKILEWSVQASAVDREYLVGKYIQRLSCENSEKQEIQNAIHSVFYHPLFSFFFRKDTLTEVSIQGWEREQKIQKIVDVLRVDDHEKTAYILDYKTGCFSEKYRNFPPDSYVKQMALYKRLLQEVYPTYKIITALLWTEIGWIQEL
ncbi:double-strand break repair helicase AddA [Alphaproteobacteria bacterium]|nr:double-strand break repair helicase AddA [Alphaproteobacteria bacterium]